MRFDLLLTNPRRVRWLLWGLALLPGSPLLLRYGPQLFITHILLLVLSLVCYNWLFRQPAWILLATDGVTWANPADGPPVRYPFAELRAYRFESSKLDDRLLLYPREGGRITLSGRLHKEFWMMRLAFEQAIKSYNQTNPGAEVAREPSSLTQFFTGPLATRVLWGLLATSVAWVGWSISRDAPGVAYLPVVLVLLPYLLLWANFYYERP